MNIRTLGNIPHVLHSKALSHTRNGDNKKQIFIDQSAKKFTMKLLAEVRRDSTAIYIMKTIICESWFSVQEEILPN